MLSAANQRPPAARTGQPVTNSNLALPKQNLQQEFHFSHGFSSLEYLASFALLCSALLCPALVQ